MKVRWNIPVFDITIKMTERRDTDDTREEVWRARVASSWAPSDRTADHHHRYLHYLLPKCSFSRWWVTRVQFTTATSRQKVIKIPNSGNKETGKRTDLISCHRPTTCCWSWKITRDIAISTDLIVFDLETKRYCLF